MSGFEDALEVDLQVISRKARLPAGDTRPAPPIWDQAAAAFRTARDDQPTHINEERIAAYGKISEALTERGYDFNRYWNTQTRGYGEAANFDAMWRDVEAERRKDPKAFAELPKTQAEFEKQWQADMRKRQAQDADTVSRSGWGPWLTGSAAGAFTDPITLGSMFISGGGSLLVSAARNALINGVVEAAEQPLVNVERQAQGRPGLTLKEGAINVGVAMAGGAALDIGGRAVGAGIGAVANRIDPIDRQMGRALAGAELDKVTPDQLLAAFDASVPEHLRTPEQQAARDVFERASEIDAQSPFVGTHEAAALHQQRVDEAMARLIGAATGSPRARATGGVEAYLAAARAQESGGNPGARSRTSSASGLYGFTDGTWINTYRAVFPGSGLNDAAILRRKGDVALQDRLMRKLTENNADWLRRNGFEADAGNLYVVHHLGQGGADKVMRAAADTRLDELLPPKVIAANPHMKGMTAGEFRQWAAERMGQPRSSDVNGARMAEGEDPAIRALDEADMMAARPVVSADGERIDPGMLDDLPELAPAAPLLKRERFPDDASWQMAQARVDAEALGLDKPELTWADVVPVERYPQARAASDARIAAEAEMNAALARGQALSAEVLRGPEGFEALKAADLAVSKWRLAQFDELEVARTMLESEADRAGGYSMGGHTAYRMAANELGFHPLSPKEIADARADLVKRVDAGGRATPSDVEMAARAAGRGPVVQAAPDGGAAPVARPVTHEAEIYADPQSPEMALQADRLWHDLANDLETDRQAYALGEGEQRSIAQVQEDFGAELKAINAVRGCL